MDTHCDSHISRSKSISYSAGPKHIGGASKAVGCLLKNKQRSFLIIKANEMHYFSNLFC